MASVAAAAAPATANLLYHLKNLTIVFSKPLYLLPASTATALPRRLPLSSHRAPVSRPSEIPCRRELANTVHLIGIVGDPVQIKQLSNGEVFAWTRFAISKSRSTIDSTWINLSFWNEVAEAAFRYVKKDQQIYVCGRLASDDVGVEPDRRQTLYKVAVQELNFIEKSVPPVSLYNPDPKCTSTRSKSESSGGNQDYSIEELWQAFFVNPLEWWDNRNIKKNPKYPDFKHKDTGEALWVDGKKNPPWLRSQLAILDSKMGSMRANQTGSRVSMMYADDIMDF